MSLSQMTTQIASPAGAVFIHGNRRVRSHFCSRRQITFEVSVSSVTVVHISGNSVAGKFLLQMQRGEGHEGLRLRGGLGQIAASAAHGLWTEEREDGLGNMEANQN